MTPGLDIALLLGAAVLLVAVGAVRLSTRLGVPSLLVYLALGVAIGEAGLGIRFDDVELTRTLGFCALIVIIAEGGLTARWTHAAPGARAGRRAVHRRRGRQHRGGRRGRAPAARAGLAAGAALRRGALVHRRGGRLRHPAPAAAAAPAGGDAGGRVRHERRPGGAAGGAAVAAGGRRRTRGGTRSLLVGYELGAGAAVGLAVGLAGALGAAPGRAALGRALPDRRGRAHRAGLRRRRGRCTPRASSPSTWPGWCWATPGCRTGRPSSASPTGWPGWPRSACSCCSACWPRRAGWTRRCCRRWSPGWPWCCWPGRCRWRSRRLPFRVGAARPGVPVLGRAARGGADRAGHHPALRAACPARSGSSTWSSCWW